VAAALFGKLWSEFLFPLFEFVELHLNEFTMSQHLVQSDEELRAQTFFAHLQRSLEPLSLGFEITNLRIRERKHGLRFKQFSPLIPAPKFGEKSEQFEVEPHQGDQ
jgi:hypothetical protein